MKNELARDKFPEVVKQSGLGIRGKIVKGDEYYQKIYSLFLQRFKQSMQAKNEKQSTVSYVDMLEIIRSLMVKAKVNIKKLDINGNKYLNWYKNTTTPKRKLANARIDLLEKFYELTGLKTEAVKDQLGELLVSFTQLIEANQLSFENIEAVRRDVFEKLGGFTKGVYVESVVQVKTLSA